jgi:hypothetical protein
LIEPPLGREYGRPDNECPKCRFNNPEDKKSLRLARDFFRFEPLGGTSVKGKDKPQKIYRLIAQSRIASRVEASIAKRWTHFVGRQKEKEMINSAELVNVILGSGKAAVELRDFILNRAGGNPLFIEIIHSLFEKALAFYQKGNLAAAAVIDARILFMCEYLLGITLVLKGEPVTAKEHLETAIKYNEKLKHTPSLPHYYVKVRMALFEGAAVNRDSAI